MTEIPKELEELDTEGILRLGRLFREMVDTVAWKEFEKIAQRQILEREQLVLSPFHDMMLPTMANGGDLQTRMIALESIKGAVIGIKQTVSIPSATIRHADDIIREKEAADAARKQQ